MIANDQAADSTTTEMTEDLEGSTKTKDKMEDHNPSLQERKRATKESLEFPDLPERNPT